MPKIMMHHADHYIIQHELDLQASNALKSPGIVEREIPPELVKGLRNSLELNIEMFALLLGINLTAMLRYESISVPPYPQGNGYRKLCLLSSWMDDPKSATDIKGLLGQEGGLSTLSGLLQSESVNSYLQLAKEHEMQQADEAVEMTATLALARDCGRA